MTTIYVDMDGVIADFAKGVHKIMPSFIEGRSDNDKQFDRTMWKSIRQYQARGGKLWLELPLMPDARELWAYVQKYNPQILTAQGDPSFGAEAQKREWIAKHFGSDVVVNVVQKAKEKAQFAKPGYILIDDKMKALDPWIAAQGVGVLHTSAASSIKQLQELGL